MNYTIEEHKHRFSAWAASRAATVNGCRFTVEQGKAILEKAGMRNLISDPNDLPKPQDIDSAHRVWRNRVIDAAAELGLTFTHGVAAKLINIYLKAGFVCGGHHDNERVRAIHPPIDSLLLNELYSQNVGGEKTLWNEAKRARWSNFNSDQYEKVVCGIREAMQGSALWEVEQYWRGYQ